MVKILYRDKQDWIDVDLEVTDWDSFSDTTKDGELRASHNPSEVVTDTWNGVVHKVQEILRKAWFIEFNIKQSELHHLDKMQGCDLIQIQDLTNNIIHDVDNSRPDLFEFNDPEQAGDTADFTVTFIYRTSKTVVNKFVPLTNLVTLQGDNTYYSKYVKLALINEKQETLIQWGTGVPKVLQTSEKTGFSVLLYMTNSELDAFQLDYAENNFTIDGVTVIEKLPLLSEELGEGIYKVQIQVVTVLNVTDITSLLSNQVTLIGGSTYYSKYEKLNLFIESEKILVRWFDGTEKPVREYNKSGYRILLNLTDAELETFKDDFNKNTFTVDAAEVLEKQPLEITEIFDGNYQVIVSVITDIEQTNHNLGANTTHRLEITDGSVYNYYTDYPIVATTQDTERKDIENEGAVKITAKGTTRRVTIMKFWLNASDAWALKEHFEIGTAKIDTSTIVLEKRNVSVEEKDYDIYEVIVECLTSTNIQYPL